MGWYLVAVFGLAWHACILKLLDASQVATAGSSSSPQTDCGSVGVTTADIASDGSLSWTDTVGSGDTEIMGGDALDSAGNLYVVGSTRGNITSAICNAGSFDIFILKYASSGSRLWQKQIGTPQHDEARSIVIVKEASGNDYVYVVGITYGAMDEELHVTNGYRQFGGRDVFLVKFDTAGNKLWSRQFGTSTDDYPYGITVDAGNILVSGGAGAGSTAIKFLASFNTTGTLLDMVADGGVSTLPIQTLLSEAESTVGSYSVVLNRPPTATVTITVSHPALLTPTGQTRPQVVFGPSTLLFTTTTWNIPQVVNVTAINDAICEHTHYASIVHSAASTDPHYQGATPFVLGTTHYFAIRDDDIASIVLSRRHLFPVEGGAKDTYEYSRTCLLGKLHGAMCRVVLTSQPWADVTVTAVAMQPQQTLLNQSQLLFTPANWNIAQSITVAAVDDTMAENEANGVHSGGAILHYSSSRDANYNTRQPSCYYLATCNCNGIVSRGNCSTSPASCVAGAPLLVCDTNTTVLGNGAHSPRLLGGNATTPVDAIPVRFGAPRLNPNPPTSTVVTLNANMELVESSVRQVYFDPAPVDDGWGGTWTLQAIQRLNASANPNPLSYTVPGLNLSAVPADVAGYVFSFLAVSNGAALAALGQDEKMLLWATCVGLERLTTQRWAYEAWPPGMADRVLDALFQIFPNLHESQLWNCGGSHFAPAVAVNVTIFDNDPGESSVLNGADSHVAVTISKPTLHVAKGGAVDSYTVVLQSPPSQTSGAAAVTATFCASTGVRDVCQTSFTPATYRDTFVVPPTATSDSVTIVANGNDRLSISPPFVTFTNMNWFLPQTFTVAAIANSKADGSLNTTITHSVFATGTLAQQYVGAAFWMAQSLPLFSTAALVPALRYNALPSLYYSPNHQTIQVVVQSNDSAGVMVSAPSKSIKEIQVPLDANAVGTTSLGICMDSLTTSVLSGVMNSVLLFVANQTSYVRFQLPFLHHAAFGSTLGAATLELKQTPYAVVNMTWLNITATLNPTFTVRVSLVQTNWSEAAFAVPPPLPLAALVQNVTMVDSVLRIDVTPLVVAIGAAMPVVAFKLDVLAASASVQLYARSDPENLPPSLVLRTQLPNLLLGQPVTQSPSSAGAAAAVDGDPTTATTDAFDWWQVALPTVQPLGTLAVFLPTTVTAGTITIVVATTELNASWTPSLGESPGILIHAAPIRRPVFVWPVPGAGRVIRLYATPPTISLADVQLYPRGVNITTTDDGYAIRATNFVTEAKVNSPYEPRPAWALASGSFLRDDNLAAGMPTTQSSVAAAGMTAFETNPWWQVDLGSIQAIGHITLVLARSLVEATACTNPATPAAPNTISTFTAARLRLSDSAMTATVNASAETTLTIPLGACFDLKLDWRAYASGRCTGFQATALAGRYLRLDLLGTGTLNVASVNVRRWAAWMTRYALLELRGSGLRPLALPAFSFLGPNQTVLPYQIFAASSSQNFNLSQPWSGSCFVGAVPSVREWLVVDFYTVQSLRSLVLSVGTTPCTGAVAPVTAISVAVYGDARPTFASPSVATDSCTCQSDAAGRTSTDTLVNQGTTLFWGAFRDLVILAPPAALPCNVLPLLSDSYSVFVVRDEPLLYAPLRQPDADVNVTTTNVVFQPTAAFPTSFASLPSAAAALTVTSVFGRTAWFGSAYADTGDSSFTLEFWAAFPSLSSGPLAIYAPSTRARFEIGLAANQSLYFALHDGDITTTVVGPAPVPSVAAATATWHHIVASYDWKLQQQALYINKWRVDTAATTTWTGSVQRSDSVVLRTSGSVVFSGPAWLASVAFYQRPLAAFDVLEHFYQPTPQKSYAMMAIRLTTNPATAVDVNLVAESTCYRWGLCNSSAQPSTLRFTAANWDTDQYVLVHATDDFMAEGLHRDTLVYEVQSAPIPVLSTQVTTAAYSMAPSADIEALFTSYALNQTVVQAQPLTAALNAMYGAVQLAWATQNITVIPTLVGGYGNLSLPPLQLAIADVDVATVEISSYYLLISEDGLRDIFQVVLTAEPKADVWIYLDASTDCYRPCGVATPSNPCPVVARPVGNETMLCNCTVSPLTLHFTPTTWEHPQAVTVVPTDDRLDESSTHFTKIVVTTTSNDPEYNNMFLESIRVAVVDNDESNILLSTAAINLTEANTTAVSTLHPWLTWRSLAATYTMVLATEPWCEVNITISNEAMGGCYRTCGYPIDPSTCGLPRPVATNSIDIRSSSVRELQAVTASMPTTNGIQIVTTTTTHVDPVFVVTLTGGYALVTYQLTLTFPAGTALGAAPYGSTFQLSTTTAVTGPLDGFVSAIALQTALVGLQPGFAVTRTTTPAAPGKPLTLTWRIAYTLASPAAPVLVLNLPQAFPGAGALAAVVPAPVPPSGLLGWSYGPVPGALAVAYGASAADLATYLETVPGINTVVVQRSTIDFGFAYTITFTSVPKYYGSVGVDLSKLVVSPAAATPVTAASANTRLPNQIGGYFQLQYRVNASYTGFSTPLRYNATTDEVAAALLLIPTLGPVVVQARQLTPELTYTWTIEFAGNVGPVSNLTAASVNLTGQGSNVGVSFVQQGDQLGGFFTLSLGGTFVHEYPTGEIYDLYMPPKTTPPLPVNAPAAAVQQALLNLALAVPLVGVSVVRVDSRCDGFGRCRQYSWQVSFPQTAGNVPELTVQSSLTGAGATLVPATLSNGTYLTGYFSISIALNGSSGTTWLLPINVTSDGMKEALEAFPFVTSNRAEDSPFDPADAAAVPKATKGVRVSRTGPYLDGGYTWLLDWSLNDWQRFTNVNISVNTSLVGQDLVPVVVATEHNAAGPRCAIYPKTVFTPDPTDSFGLRGSCVYPLVTTVDPERYLCNMTVGNPRQIFDASNWYLPQPISVYSVHDFLDERSVQSNVTLSALTHEAYTLDFIYAGLAIPSVTVGVTDVDVAKVVVSKTLVVVSENGSLVDSYTVVLTTEPRASVLVVAHPYIDWTDCYRFGLCNVTLDTASVLFTVEDWYVPQVISLHATADHLDEADVHFGGISHDVFSADAKYNHTPVANITVQIYDADTSAVLVSKTKVTISEAGAGDTYTIVLATEPWAKVTITPVSNGTDALGNIISLSAPIVFSSLNWNVSQAITINAVHDWRVDPLPHATLVTHVVSTNDLIYINCSVANVTATTTDMDIAGLELSSPSINGTEGSPTPITYSVRLTSKPWFPVVVSFNGSYDGCNFGVCNVTVLTTSLVFGAANWSTWQPVRVQVNADPFDEGGLHLANISHTLTTADGWYTAVTPPLMVVRIADTKQSGVALSTDQNLTVAQGSFNASFAVVLTSAPWSDVSVLLQIPSETFVPRGGLAKISEPLIVATSAASGAVVSSLLFTLANWNVSQVVVLSALGTGSLKPLTLQTSITAQARSADARYNATAATSLFVTVLGKEDVPPPVPLAAIFDSTGVKIHITFDSTVFQNATMTVEPTQPTTNIAARYVLPNAPFSCALVWNLTASPTFSLGAGANCLWLNLTTMQMVLGTGATIAPKDVLTLNDCGSQYMTPSGVCTSPFVLKSRDYNVLYTTASVAVTLGPVVVPQIVLVGPKSIGPCGVLALDATGSSGGANRPFSIQWFGVLSSAVNTTTDAASVYAQSMALYSTIAPYCTANTTIVVSRAVLLSGRSYVMGLRLTNFFAQTGVASQVVATLSDPIPTVSIVGPGLLRQPRTAPVMIQAATAPTTSGCAGVTSAVVYAWTVFATDTANNTVVAKVANTAVDPRYFVLPADTLAANTNYTFRITASYAAQPTASSSDQAVVSVLPSPIVAQFAGGSHVLGALDALTLNASASYDPDLVSRVLQYSWSCLDVTPAFNATTNASLGAANLPCLNPLTGSKIDLSAVGSGVLVLVPGSFAAPKTLRFTVVVTAPCNQGAVGCATRSASASTDVTTVAGRIPIVQIQASATQVNPSSKVVLTPNVSSLYPFTTLWSQDVGDLNLSQSGFLFPLTTQQNVLAPNILTPGKTYVFRLTALDSTGNMGSGTISISVNAPPTPGTITISPAQGTAIADQFTVTCSGWTDANLPLTYAFYLNANSTLVPLASELTLPSTQVRLFLNDAAKPNDTVTVVAHITDALGGTSTTSATALVLQPVTTNTQAFWTTISNSTLNAAITDGNFNDALSVLVSTTAVLSARHSLATGCNSTTCGTNGACNTAATACICAVGFSGSSCSVPDAAVNEMAQQMLGSLLTLTTVVQPTAATLTQSALALSSIVALNDEAAIDTTNVGKAASVLATITSTAVALPDPSAFATASGGSVLSATAVLARSSNASATTSRRRLASAASGFDTLLESLFTMVAISSAGLLAGQAPVAITSPQLSSYSVLGDALPFGLNGRPASVALTPVVDACIPDTYFLDVVAWTTPVHTTQLPSDTPAVSPSVEIGIHTLTAYQAAQLQGQPLAMSSLGPTDACVLAQQDQINTDLLLPLVTVTIGHGALTAGPRFATTCLAWNSSIAQWDSTQCTKVTAASTPTATVCSCTRLGGLEVVVAVAEVLAFEPLNPTVYRDDPSSVIPGVALGLLMCAYAVGLRWSARQDKADKEALRLQRLGKLSKATWNELLQVEQAKTVEDIAPRNMRAPLVMDDDTIGHAFLATWQPGDRADPTEGEATAVAAEAAVLASYAAITEVALFGTLRLQSQHLVVRRGLQLLNGFLVVVATVFIAIGVDFYAFLGNTTANVAVAVFGPPVGLGFLLFGLALAAVSGLGLLAAAANTSSRLRSVYIVLLLLLLVGETILIGIAHKHVVDVADFPKATFSFLQGRWTNVSPAVRESIQNELGCCGFATVADAPELPCPDVALLAPERACFPTLTAAASTLFGQLFSSLAGLVIVQVVALGLANVLVRWEALRISALAAGTSPKPSLVEVLLRCTLPVASHLSACAMLFSIVAGLDVLLQWDLFALASVTVFVRLEFGIPIVIVSCLYLGLHLHGASAVAGAHVRGMKTYVFGHVVLLIAGAALAIVLTTVSANLGTYTNLQTILQARYLGLSAQAKLELETDLVCCGFNATSQGACAPPTAAPLCAGPVTTAIANFAFVTQERLTTYLLSQLGVAFFTGLFVAMQKDEPTLAAPASHAADEFTDPLNVLVRRVCTQIVLLASLVVAFCGALLVGVGVDILLETNIVAVSAVLTAFSYYTGAYILLLGVLLLGGSGLGLFAGLTRAQRWLWYFGALLLSACVCCLALFAAAYRMQNPTVAQVVNATLYQTWKGFVPATKQFVQDAYGCCGYDRIGDNFTLPYTVATWTLNATSGVKTTVTAPACPAVATDGCAPAMLATLQTAARAGETTAIFLAAVLFVLFVTTAVLYYRQGRKRAVTWQVLVLQCAFLGVSTGVGLSLLGLGLLGIDVAAGTTVFTSNVVQVLFGGRIGGAVIASVTVAMGLTSYGVYGAINKTLHITLVYLVVAFVLVLVAWSCTGVVGGWVLRGNWQARLDAYLDGIWSGLVADDRSFVASSYACCGYQDPVLLPSGLLQFDRAVANGTLQCPPLAATGCRTALLSDATVLLDQLYKLLAAYATLQSALWVVAGALLHGLVALQPSVWAALRRKMRWWLAKYRDDVKKRHVALSLHYTYDPKFTRCQRLTCILCAVVAMTCVDAAVTAAYGCTRLGPVTCEPQTPGEIVGYGLLYSLVSVAVQLLFAALFQHVRHRQDDDDGAKVAERRRKEKVYLREVFHHSLQAVASKFGTFAMATTEERFYSWLATQVARATVSLSWLRVLLAVAFCVYIGLSQLGLGFYVYGVQVPGTFLALTIPAVLLVTSVLVALCRVVKAKKRFTRHAYVGYLVATAASSLLICFICVAIFMIVQAMDEPTTPPNWTQRNANFSVVASVRAIWLNDTVGYNRKQWQTQLQCCGLPEFPLRPCPMGSSTLQNVTAQRVDGTTVTKTVTIVHDLGGCLDPIVGQIQQVVTTVVAILVTVAVLELCYAACTYFLARDLVISWDTQLRRASMKNDATAEPLDEVPAREPAPPQRGRMLSSLVQTSINNVSKSVAGLLSKSSLSPATRPKPATSERLAHMKLQLRMRYPAWVPRVVFAAAFLWVVGTVAGTLLLALRLADDGAWLWLGAATLSAALHLAVIEPLVLFGCVVSQTLALWWESTWLAVLIGMGRAMLHLDAGDEAVKAIMDPFTRIRHNAATVIQRRWVCKLCRLRYLIILRVARETEHRTKIETRLRTIKAAVSSFTREETEAFTMLFRDADHAKTGLVSYKVVSHAVHALGVQVPAAVVKEYLVALDPGFVELIDIDYFLYAMSCIRAYHQAQQEAHNTEDALVVSHSPEAKFQVKRQNVLRELKEKRESVSKHLMSKVGKLASQLHRHEAPKEKEAKEDEPKLAGAYILLNTKNKPRPGSATTARGGPVPPPTPLPMAVPEPPVDAAVQERSAEAVAARPDTRGQLSVRATKDIEKAMKLLKTKHEGPGKKRKK
ncbi:transmembrane protein [Achlya hypogyna]|uniref:Transmembrane protein n=1 Tax=Achlya hypogyna TaxID=1202772 RepID=A0A1V9ZPD1_ACHHY|nr:transmembrane protein [Achlya hypogyna]